MYCVEKSKDSETSLSKLSKNLSQTGYIPLKEKILKNKRRKEGGEAREWKSGRKHEIEGRR
jgi:hypothetical protein